MCSFLIPCPAHLRANGVSIRCHTGGGAGHQIEFGPARQELEQESGANSNQMGALLCVNEMDRLFVVRRSEPQGSCACVCLHFSLPINDLCPV